MAHTCNGDGLSPHCGDCLEILEAQLPDESPDLLAEAFERHAQFTGDPNGPSPLTFAQVDALVQHIRELDDENERRKR